MIKALADVTINGVTILYGTEGFWAEVDKKFIFVREAVNLETRLPSFTASEIAANKANFQCDADIQNILDNPSNYS